MEYCQHIVSGFRKKNMACDFGEMFQWGGSSSYRILVKHYTIWPYRPHTHRSKVASENRINLLTCKRRANWLVYDAGDIAVIGVANKKETIFTRETFIYTLQMKVNWRAINLYGSHISIYTLSSCVCNKVKRIHKDITLKFNRISRV